MYDRVLVPMALDHGVSGTTLTAAKTLCNPGGQITALSAADCSTLDLGIHQTNSSFNDVWIIEGSAHIACPGLTGEITFAGCH